MKARDRIVLITLAAVAVLAAVWIMAVSPERKKANQLASEVSNAQSQLQSAESQLANASAAQAKYQTAYASIVNLGKAVPASQEVSSLIYQLAKATGEKNVEFASITSGGSGSSSSSSSSSSSASASAASAGFSQMPFTFVFNGSFTNLYSLFEQLDGFAQRTTAGDVQVSGRLLTVQSVQLAPGGASGSSSSGSGGGKSKEELTGTISATAYVLPAGQTLTGGATPAGPASDEAAGAERKAAGASATSSNAPAVVEANP
jgi:hypothetical protein